MDRTPEQLPLVIGVTGHRDLRDDDIANLEAEVAAVFVRLRGDFLEQDSKTPIIVLSALAEGADQLVARVALAQGAELISPMPLPIDEYRRDFQNGIKPDAAAKFDEWLKRGVKMPIIPFTPGNSLEAARQDPMKRAEQYRAAGMFIARNCDILIALWDGNREAGALGGAADIVGLKLSGVSLTEKVEARACLDASDPSFISLLRARQRPRRR